MSKINENRMETAMRALGFRDNLCGTEMLRIAIREYEPGMVITKELYPMIANRVGSTPSRVERAMRHAIETAWLRCDLKTADRYFGNTIDPRRCKPVNSHFIARVASAVLLGD